MNQRDPSHLAGVDEAGRGPLAGPVVAAAVILGPDFQYERIKDSKRLSVRNREEASRAIRKGALAWSIGAASPLEIDRWNIHQATLVAMRRAVLGLRREPGFVVFDGSFTPRLPWPGASQPRADATERPVSAASILAKVFRDRYMLDLDEKYPQYGFRQHKGYPTPVHLHALERCGPCPEHRFSFRPVRNASLSKGDPTSSSVTEPVSQSS